MPVTVSTLLALFFLQHAFGDRCLHNLCFLILEVKLYMSIVNKCLYVSSRRSRPPSHPVRQIPLLVKQKLGRLRHRRKPGIFSIHHIFIIAFRQHDLPDMQGILDPHHPHMIPVNAVCRADAGLDGLPVICHHRRHHGGF